MKENYQIILNKTIDEIQKNNTVHLSKTIMLQNFLPDYPQMYQYHDMKINL